MGHFIGIEQLSPEQIHFLLDRAEYWASQDRQSEQPLSGRFVANLFFEPSTRTRFSFEMAEKRLGAEVLNFAADASSTQKGETLADTLRTLEAMGVDAAVIRHKENGILDGLTKQVKMNVINAGEGTREHPTQALLDLLTIRQAFGRLEGLSMAIIGDIKHSRVAHSHRHAAAKTGIRLMFAGPLDWLDDDLPSNCPMVEVDEAVRTADVVIMLRVQKERMGSEEVPDQAAYHMRYGLTEERLGMMKPTARIMHPAPINRGMEIADAAVDDPRSLIFKQVTNGVAVRMAVLETSILGLPLPQEEEWLTVRV
jgi:aspartate carbamoyltransferase catalytic subunit